MPYLVDGNNVAGGKNRERVRQAALRLTKHEKLRVVIFFDGPPPGGGRDVERLGAVEVRYVPHADTAMLAYLERAGKGFIVVTSDRELAQKAKNLGATVMTREAFWLRFGERGGPSEKKDSEISPELLDPQEYLRGVVPLPAKPNLVRRSKRVKRLSR